MVDIAIIGLGPAGIFALASLPEEMLERVLVLEPTAIGGDLAVKYGGIRTNINKQDIVTTFRKIPRWSEARKPLTFLNHYKDEECPFIYDVCKQIRDWILPDINRTTFRIEKMTKLIECEKGWKIIAEHELFEAQKILLCTGSKPKWLDLPKATIPLHLCLCKSQLEQHVSANDKVIVFGTAHSGTLVLKNLYEIGCKDVVGIYKGDKPFVYARDGILGGIKQESAQIADTILKHEWQERTPSFIPIGDFSKTYRAIEKANCVIYALGFEKACMSYEDRNGCTKSLNHIQSNGQFHEVKQIWGFGIAYPSNKQNTDHPDVGFDGFITALQNALPAILQPVP